MNGPKLFVAVVDAVEPEARSVHWTLEDAVAALDSEVLGNRADRVYEVEIGRPIWESPVVWRRDAAEERFR